METVRNAVIARAALLVPFAIADSVVSAAAPTVLLDLPAGQVRDGVAALGRQANVSISVDDPAVWARRVGPIRGRMTVAAALKRLLAGTDARALQVQPGLWRVGPAPLPRPHPARPAAPPSLTNDDAIVVTASKRDLRLSDFAGTANILDARDLAFGGPQGTDAILARLASVSSTYLGAGRNKLFIRGIADSSFTGPTQSTVGQYVGDLRLTYNAPDPDLRLYDIASVEVLEGPQGTLYGAGSLGGIIRVTPAAPDLTRIGGSITGGASATQHGAIGGDLSAMLNVPVVSDRVGLRLVGYGVTDGGYIDNRLTGRNDINRTNTYGGRGTLRIDPGDGWTIDLGGVAQSIHGDDSQYADSGAPRLTRSSPVDEGFSTDYRLAQLVIGKQWDSLHFRSSTGIIRQDLDETFDATPSGEAPQIFRQRNDTDLLASELRLWQPMGDRFGWVIGGSYTHNRTRLTRALGDPDAPQPLTGVSNRVSELTAYGEASLRLTSWLSVTGGGRVSRSRLSGGALDQETPSLTLVEALARAQVTASRMATSLLPSIALVANPAEGTTLYARFQQGFRPGGLAIENDFVRRFRNDRVETAETGLRYRRPGPGAIDAALSASYTRWRNIQADFVDGSGLITTDNIGDGTIWSVSASGGWRPLPGLRIEAAFTFNDGRVTDPAPVFAALLFRAPSATTRIPNVARYSARIGMNWEGPISDTLSLRAEAWGRYVGKSRLGVGPVLGETQGDYPDSAVTVRVGTASAGVTLGVTNLSDSVGNRFALGTPFVIGRNQITPLRPRTVRLGVDASF